MKFSNIAISGIVVVALAVAATLLPVGDPSSREDFQMLEVEYGLDGLEQENPPFDDLSFGIPDAKKLNIATKDKGEPAEKLPAVSKKTIASLLEEEGFIPVVEFQEVQPGLVLTIYMEEAGSTNY